MSSAAEAKSFQSGCTEAASSKGREDGDEVIDRMILSLKGARLQEVLGKLGGMNLTHQDLDGDVIVYQVTESASNIVLARTADRPIESIKPNRYL